MHVNETFEAMDPDDPSKTITVKLAQGKLYSVVCPDCNLVLGGGVDVDSTFFQYLKESSCSSLKSPCIFCGKGPGILKYLGHNDR